MITIPVPDMTPIQGELQTQIMSTIWRLGSGNVDDIREALPSRYRGAYTTVQTVLNRLAERGLLTRKRHGRSFTYTPTLSEADYLSRSISRALAGASSDARPTVLAQLYGQLDPSERDELAELADRVAAKRKPRT